VGLCAELFELHEQVLRAARELVAHCACQAGCPSCVGPAVDEQDAKSHTLRVLDAVLGNAA
jgi:DEAD/DEAH box helicase domain-containing protein